MQLWNSEIPAIVDEFEALFLQPVNKISIPCQKTFTALQKKIDAKAHLLRLKKRSLFQRLTTQILIVSAAEIDDAVGRQFDDARCQR